MKLVLLALVVCTSMSFTGCIRTVDGRNRAGVPFKKDSIEGKYERTVTQVVDAAKGVLERLGKLIAENRIANTLQAKVNTDNVYVKVDEVDSKVSRVVVQVRTRGGGANIDLAAQIEKEIALSLAKER